MSRNPYALEDDLAVAEAGQETLPTTRAEAPVIEGENPAVHFVHHDCQKDNDFIISWCGIALDESGQREEGVATDESEYCQECVRVVQTGGHCPVCGITGAELARQESSDR